MMPLAPHDSNLIASLERVDTEGIPHLYKTRGKMQAVDTVTSSRWLGLLDTDMRAETLAEWQAETEGAPLASERAAGHNQGSGNARQAILARLYRQALGLVLPLSKGLCLRHGSSDTDHLYRQHQLDLHYHSHYGCIQVTQTVAERPSRDPGPAEARPEELERIGAWLSMSSSSGDRIKGHHESEITRNETRTRPPTQSWGTIGLASRTPWLLCSLSRKCSRRGRNSGHAQGQIQCFVPLSQYEAV